MLQVVLTGYSRGTHRVLHLCGGAAGGTHGVLMGYSRGTVSMWSTAGGTHVLARLGGDADRRGDLVAHRRQRAQLSTTLSALLSHCTVQRATCNTQHATDNMQHAAGKSGRLPTEMTVRSIVRLFVCIAPSWLSPHLVGRALWVCKAWGSPCPFGICLFVCLFVCFACGAALRGDSCACVAARQRRRRVVAASDAQCAAMQRIAALQRRSDAPGRFTACGVCNTQRCSSAAHRTACSMQHTPHTPVAAAREYPTVRTCEYP
jgi:hypothetical protein